MAEAYNEQDRGDAGAYDRYLRGMDASMRQKVALTAAHLLCEGDVADMGMGSGSGSFALASLYPDLRVVGVDVNPEMVARAAEQHRLPNLRFAVGDIATPCFADGELEAIFDSSVLHHVTSFNGYDRGAAARALGVQARALADHGVLIVRDFVDPGPGMVHLDVREDDGDGTDDPRSCSTAALLERFAREFRVLLPEPQRGFPCRAVGGAPPGFRRYELSHTHAAEFVLRKDYRADWGLEVQEEYTYATQGELETVFAALGLRVLASTPLRNPWIVARRFRDQIALHRDGRALDVPATNLLIAGQKVPLGEGVRFTTGDPVEPLDYLERSHWRRLDSGLVFDLVRRPNTTVDVLPWFRRGGAVHVLARRGYPRPILGCGDPTIDGMRPSTWVTEPLSVQTGDKPLGQTVEELLEGFPGTEIVSIEPGAAYYPSPGGLQEEVRSVHVEVAPINVTSGGVQLPLDRRSGFSTSGELRAIEARQLLRAAQVGGLPDARLELNVYDLLLRLGQDPGAWIGEALGPLADGPEPADLSLDAPRPRRRRFRRAEAADSRGFLDLRCHGFCELDANGAEVASRRLELVVPRRLSTNTVAVAALRRRGDDILLGVDDDDLPAAQCISGASDLLVAPAWRLPREVDGIEVCRAFVRARLAAEYGATVGGVWELGGAWHPSAGVTPEVVMPLAVEIVADSPAPRQLRWVSLRDAVTRRHRLQDGHLRIVALRAAHALGLIEFKDPGMSRPKP